MSRAVPMSRAKYAGVAVILLAGAAAVGIGAGGLGKAAADTPQAGKAVTGKERLFEMRIYTTHPGKLEALNARFRDHTNKLFEKHGMSIIGFWTPVDPKKEKDTLVYILAYPDASAKEKSWKGFRDDPEWKKAKEASEVNGPLVAKVEEMVLKPTDYSPLR